MKSVCIHVCACVHNCMHMHVCICVCICVQVYVYVRMCMHVFICMHLCICACMRVHVCVVFYSERRSSHFSEKQTPASWAQPAGVHGHSLRSEVGGRRSGRSGASVPAAQSPRGTAQTPGAAALRGWRDSASASPRVSPRGPFLEEVPRRRLLTVNETFRRCCLAAGEAVPSGVLGSFHGNGGGGHVREARGHGLLQLRRPELSGKTRVFIKKGGRHNSKTVVLLMTRERSHWARRQPPAGRSLISRHPPLRPHLGQLLPPSGVWSLHGHCQEGAPGNETSACPRPGPPHGSATHLDLGVT